MKRRMQEIRAPVGFLNTVPVRKNSVEHSVKVESLKAVPGRQFENVIIRRQR